MWEYKGLFVIFSGIFIYIFGGWHDLFGIFIALWFLDVVTGLVASGKEGKISSYKGLIGIGKKIIIFCLISLGHFADVILGTGDVIRNASLMWFVVNEMVSIVENCGRAGMAIPPKLQQAIDILRPKEDKPDDDVENKGASK